MDFLDSQLERYRRWEQEDREWRRIQEEKADARRAQLRIEEEQRHSEQKQKYRLSRNECSGIDRETVIYLGLTALTGSFVTSLLIALIKWLFGEL